MKEKSRCIVFMILLVVFLGGFSSGILAEDNADTGTGDSGGADVGKAYYRSAEYMYKVSVYVGTSDLASERDSLATSWKKIGNSPIYVKPSSFTLPSKAIGSKGSKIDYQNGATLSPTYVTDYVTDNPPPIPITNGGNINSVKAYFGDTRTLLGLIDVYASKMGTTREGLVSGMEFTINGVKKQYPASSVLPMKVGEEYQNQVPWLIIYEPVIISYLKDRTTILAFTATEYALAQKLGYFNFKGGSDGQYLSAMTHTDLPNSIFLEESWFGFPVTSALADGVHWSDDRIISGGGWGMRMLRANSANVIENDTSYDYEYRVDTDVVTSVRIYASEDITPDNRHVSESAYGDPQKNTATVTMTANGYVKSTEIVLPKGGSQLVWLKWHTPSSAGSVDVQVQVTGNEAARIDGVYRGQILRAKVEDVSQNEPPNPTAKDRQDNFVAPALPMKADKSSAEWGIYSSSWKANWVWNAKWVWESDWRLVPVYGWVATANGLKWQVKSYQWEDYGQWVDRGQWLDKGAWEYTYTNYYASLSATMNLSPDAKAVTEKSDTIKSGYGVNTRIITNLNSNAPSSQLTYAQNALTYFPEFLYKTYWRLLDTVGYGEFAFKKNPYSTYESRVHFTPIWYPDGSYRVYSEVFDLWTPAGMLRIGLSDLVAIEGNLYQDWHIGPK